MKNRIFAGTMSLVLALALVFSLAPAGGGDICG